MEDWESDMRGYGMGRVVQSQRAETIEIVAVGWAEIAGCRGPSAARPASPERSGRDDSEYDAEAFPVSV